jgi:hypothetical protein
MDMYAYVPVGMWVRWAVFWFMGDWFVAVAWVRWAGGSRLRWVEVGWQVYILEEMATLRV